MSGLYSLLSPVNASMLPSSVFEADSAWVTEPFFLAWTNDSSTLPKEIYSARLLKSRNVWEWSEISAVRPVSCFSSLEHRLIEPPWSSETSGLLELCECWLAHRKSPWTVGIVKSDKRLLFDQSARAWMELGERVAERKVKRWLQYWDMLYKHFYLSQYCSHLLTLM